MLSTVLILTPPIAAGLATYLLAYLQSNGDRSNRIPCACLLASLSSMTAVITAHHLRLMWIAVEATS